MVVALNSRIFMIGISMRIFVGKRLEEESSKRAWNMKQGDSGRYDLKCRGDDPKN